MEQVEKETHPHRQRALPSGLPPRALPLDPVRGAAPEPREGPSALSTPKRVYWNLVFSLAGVTARDRRAATRYLRLAAAAAEMMRPHPVYRLQQDTFHAIR